MFVHSRQVTCCGPAASGMRLAQALAFKGDIARTRGWVVRLRRLLDEADVDCVEKGFLEHLAGMCRIFTDGDIVAARTAFARAIELGEKFRDRELLTFARMAEGRCLIYVGEISDGLALLDEAMVSVEAREIPPMAVGDRLLHGHRRLPRAVRPPPMRAVERLIRAMVC